MYRLLHNLLKPLTQQLHYRNRGLSPRWEVAESIPHTGGHLNYQFIGKLHCILGHGKVAESTITGLLLVPVSLGFATVGLSVVPFFLCSSFLHWVCSALLNRWLVSCLFSILRLPLLLFNTKLKLSINNGITSTTQKHIANCNNYLSFFIQTLGISIKKSVVHSKCSQK